MKKKSKRTDAFIEYVRQYVLDTVNAINLTADPNIRPLPTIYFLQPKQGRCTYIECPWDNEAQKKAMLHQIATRISDSRRELNAVAVAIEAVATEVRIDGMPANTDSPGTDLLYIAVDDRHGRMFVEAYNINRQNNSISLEKINELGTVSLSRRIVFGRFLRDDEKEKQWEDNEKQKRARWGR